jgi:hypothetical protein
MRLPSITVTSNFHPAHSMVSPVTGKSPLTAISNPARVL